jgi:hypothetical protein
MEDSRVGISQPTNEASEYSQGAGNWKDMGNIYLIDCAAGKASQQWDAMADGRIALKAASPGMNEFLLSEAFS